MSRQHGRLVDRVTVQRRHMKKKIEGRTVLLHPEAKTALATWLLTLCQRREVTSQTFVFQSRQGGNQPISTVQAWRILHDAVTTNELTGKVGTHAMRKTFANRVYHQLNHDLVKTQRAMGHKNINSTVAYQFVEVRSTRRSWPAETRPPVTKGGSDAPRHDRST